MVSVTHDIDTLRNQLLACRQQCMAYDQARIDAEALARKAVADKRRAEDRLRAAITEQSKHRCPPDLRERVNALESELSEVNAKLASARQARDRAQAEAEKHKADSDHQYSRLQSAMQRLQESEKDRKAARDKLHQAQSSHRNELSKLRREHDAEIKAQTSEWRATLAKQSRDYQMAIDDASAEAETQRDRADRMTQDRDRLAREIEKQRTVADNLQKQLKQRPAPETVNERLMMRVRQLEAERGGN